MGQYVKRLRILTLALIFSGALNIGLAATYIFSRWQESRGSFSVCALAKKEEEKEILMAPFFTQMSKLSFHELLTVLTNRDPIGEGYLKRDMAVSALVCFHHFHLEKALSGSVLQKREVSFGKDSRAYIFPGLSDDQFDAIIRFAYEEKWPLTTEGIFNLLKKRWPSKQDASLVQAFFVTPEFHALQALFKKQENSLLLQLVCEGDWAMLDSFAQEQSQILDFSVEKRRSLLLRYLSVQSHAAVDLLLRTDFQFVAKRLEDSYLIQLISLLPEKSPDAERLCLQLLGSPRTDAVWISAASFLYAYAGEEVPSSFNLQAAMSRFVPSSVQYVSVVQKSKDQEPLLREEIPAQALYHIVKDGESLWKIARQYSVKVDDLVRINGLEKDRLYPGMTLKVRE